MNKLTYFICLFACVAIAALFLAPPGFLLASEIAAAALIVSVLVLWGTGVIPEYLTALIFFLVTMLFSMAPSAVIFSGFQTTAFWLIFSGLFIGLAITTTGLGNRIAATIADGLNRSYPSTVMSITFLGVVFAFIMPSAMGRVVLLVPVALSIASHLGYAKGSQGRIGILLALLLGSFIPAFSILTANVPNIILAGLAESEFDHSILYGPYLLLHFPVLGLLKALLIGWIVGKLFDDQPDITMIEHGSESSGPLPSDQRKLAFLLVVMVAFWFTDFIHGISPAWIALTGAILLISPGIGLLSAKQCADKINYHPLFFVAGILGFGAFINETGIIARLADLFLHKLPFSQEAVFYNYMLTALISTVTGLFTTLPGVPAVITPLSDQLSQLSGFDLESVLMLQVVGFSILLLPYQAPPIIIGMQLAGERMGHAIKVCLIVAAFTIILLLPLNYLWWELLVRLG